MKSPVLTVDAIIEIRGNIILIKRSANPFRGYWALPGGRVDYRETIEHAAVREAREETGLRIRIKDLVGVYSDPKRNPNNEHRVSAVFSAGKTGGKIRAGDDAGEIGLFSGPEIRGMRLAFDHNKILFDYFAQRTKK